MATDGHGASHEEVAQVVRSLIDATGLTLKDLAQQTHYSAQSWSAYQNNKRRVPPAALQALLEVSNSAPADLTGRARHVLKALEDAERPIASETTKTTATTPPTEHAEEPADHAEPPSSRGLVRTVGIILISVIAVFGVAATGAGIGIMLLSDNQGHRADRPAVAAPSSPRASQAGSATASPNHSPTHRSRLAPAHPPGPLGAPTHLSTPSPSPHAPTHSASTAPTCRRNYYKVDSVGDVLNESGERIGQVVPGDIFIRDTTNTHPPMRFRYYGKVASAGISGYVLQEKLTPTCP
jgi:transcriptional regulator with XRE-family HTH domain